MVTNETIKKKGWRKKLKLFIALLLSMSIFFTGCTEQQVEDTLELSLDILLEFLDPENYDALSQEITTVQQPVIIDGTMTAHFIDVGQGDATLFVQDEYVMLFDTGTFDGGDELVEYIKNLSIEHIDVLVLTHPHDDHMGGAAAILNTFKVGKIYGPDIFDIESLDENDWFDAMIDAVDRIDAELNEGIEEENQVSIWNLPKNADGKFVKFTFGDAVVEFYSPLEDEYSDLNDYSICAKVSFGDVDIFLTGDATSKVEKALIKEGYDLDVEIFHASHHGSKTGNSEEFIEAMSPECIVISCGMKNRYNHPAKEVMDLFKELNLPVYRTDESGSIVMTTNGEDYSFDKKPGTYTSGAEYKQKGN